MQRGSLTFRWAFGWIKLVIFCLHLYLCCVRVAVIMFLFLESLCCFYQGVHFGLVFWYASITNVTVLLALLSWIVFSRIVVCLYFGLLDMVLHNWIIETCIYPFCGELKSGSPDCFAIADTTYTKGERLQMFCGELNFFNDSLFIIFNFDL